MMEMARKKAPPVTAGSAGDLEVTATSESHNSGSRASGAHAPAGTRPVRLGKTLLGHVGEPRTLKRVEIRLGRRRNELAKLVADRASRRLVMTDPAGWAAVIADIAAHHPAGLSAATFADASIRLRLQLPQKAIDQALSVVGEWVAKRGDRYRAFADLAVGRMVGLTAEERRRLAIVTVRAVDETIDERKAFVLEARMKRDRETKRAKRGRLPRSVYESKSAEKTRPWIAEGVSRRTYYRRRSKAQTALEVDGTSVSPDNTSLTLLVSRHTCATSTDALVHRKLVHQNCQKDIAMTPDQTIICRAYTLSGRRLASADGGQRDHVTRLATTVTGSKPRTSELLQIMTSLTGRGSAPTSVSARVA